MHAFNFARVYIANYSIIVLLLVGDLVLSLNRYANEDSLNVVEWPCRYMYINH